MEKYRWSWIGIGALLLLLALPARADEALFGYIYTTDSLPKGNWEYEQWLTMRNGKARGSYRSLDARSEFEYGFTDRFSTSFYLNSSWLYQQGVYDPENPSQNLPDMNSYDIDSVSVEMKYRLLSPYVDPIGISVYLEPELETRNVQTGQDTIGKALEFRLILHKTYLDDLLTIAANVMLEPEWESVLGGPTEKELWFEFTLGASYRFLPNWWLGFEFRNHREFPDMDLGNQEHSAFFFGPALHYGAKTFWVTLTVLPQIYGSPGVLGTAADGTSIDGGSLHLGQHEKIETRLKFGINL